MVGNCGQISTETGRFSASSPRSGRAARQLMRLSRRRLADPDRA